MTIGHNRIPAPDRLRSFIERVERVEEEIKALNADKSEIYAEAKSTGFDKKAMQAVIARRRKDPADVEEHEMLVATYLAALDKPAEVGTNLATRARAHEEAPPRAPVADRNTGTQAAISCGEPTGPRGKQRSDDAPPPAEDFSSNIVGGQSDRAGVDHPGANEGVSVEPEARSAASVADGPERAAPIPGMDENGFGIPTIADRRFGEREE